ncbi:membrane-bound metal-dependent hydrolase YbcI (DUF457 family) [Halorubrum trapanicum]|uniref:Membrane-bound metal-dependent hydrolase YbcI (DUF457 family) n=1 Tax=Halorubrum trapanicum TaxID=29284 RepID=A0A8J7RAJ1_9EURY|nr:hypothetical protein [Halorubrum trapanicum]MBP1903377.1 membrane-bound metal-dependent hydrolase YbcI (DUF457 family) [Halorubrum trapanicum]
MGDGGVESDRDGEASLGPVHRSRAREFGAALWGLAAVSIVVIGRYATIGRVQATLQESWLVLVQVVAVVVVFGVLSSLLAAYMRSTGVSR